MASWFDVRLLCSIQSNSLRLLYHVLWSVAKCNRPPRHDVMASWNPLLPINVPCQQSWQKSDRFLYTHLWLFHVHVSALYPAVVTGEWSVSLYSPMAVPCPCLCTVSSSSDRRVIGFSIPGPSCVERIFTDSWRKYVENVFAGSIWSPSICNTSKRKL